jgi:hypothetical protein
MTLRFFLFLDFYVMRWSIFTPLLGSLTMKIEKKTAQKKRCRALGGTLAIL